jgi:hypothetical protein
MEDGVEDLSVIPDEIWRSRCKRKRKKRNAVDESAAPSDDFGAGLSAWTTEKGMVRECFVQRQRMHCTAPLPYNFFRYCKSRGSARALHDDSISQTAGAKRIIYAPVTAPKDKKIRSANQCQVLGTRQFGTRRTPTRCVVSGFL